MRNGSAQVMVFVDAGYVFGVMRTFYGVPRVDDLVIDYEGLADLIRARVSDRVGAVLRIRWYDATDPMRRITNPRAVGMASVAGVRLVEGHLVYRDGVAQQKAVDTRLVADMLTIAFQRQVDHFVVITGDEDMVPGVEAAQDLGLNVEVWSIEAQDMAPTVSRELAALADRHHTIDIADVAQVITAAQTAPRREVLEPDAVLAHVTETPTSPSQVSVRPSTPTGVGAVATPTPRPFAPLLAPTSSPPRAPSGRLPKVEIGDVDPPNLWGTDQAAYHEPLDWLSVNAGTEQQKAAATGAIYAVRWWAAASEESQTALAEVCPGPSQFALVPPKIDKDLLRFADDHGVETWGPQWVKARVRNGFWDQIGELAAAGCRSSREE